MNRLTRSSLCSSGSLQLFLSATARISPLFRSERTALRKLLPPKHRTITTSATKPATVLPENHSDGYSGAGLEQRGKLPEELSRNVLYLTCYSAAGFCDVYLVGTTHVSLESCREVRAVIDYLKPEVVFLELCGSRVNILTSPNLKIPTAEEVLEMYKKDHNIFELLYSWFLAKEASELEVFPGLEFRVAFEEARKYNAKVVLGDRSVQVTLKRTLAKMPTWHKPKLLFSFLFQPNLLPSAEELNKMLKEMNVDVLTFFIQEMSKKFPTLTETLLDERDQYMSRNILRYAREHAVVVAVVGKGHLKGIKKHWEKPVKMDKLLEVPPDKPAVSAKKEVLTSVGVGVAGLAVILGLYLAYKI